MDKTRRRKLLVASIGVATVSYVVAEAGCRTSTITSGNLPAPPPADTAPPPPVVGNLPAPPPMESPATPDAGPPTRPTTPTRPPRRR